LLRGSMSTSGLRKNNMNNFHLWGEME
jgi:hypothetical protein